MLALISSFLLLASHNRHKLMVKSVAWGPYFVDERNGDASSESEESLVGSMVASSRSVSPRSSGFETVEDMDDETFNALKRYNASKVMGIAVNKEDRSILKHHKKNKENKIAASQDLQATRIEEEAKCSAEELPDSQDSQDTILLDETQCSDDRGDKL